MSHNNLRQINECSNKFNKKILLNSVLMSGFQDSVCVLRSADFIGPPFTIWAYQSSRVVSATFSVMIQFVSTTNSVIVNMVSKWSTSAGDFQDVQ